MNKQKLVYLDSIESSYSKKEKIILKDCELKQINAQEANAYCKKLSCEYMTIFCKQYPNQFKVLPHPPWVIYYLGDIKLLDQEMISIIGSRKCTEYGKNATGKIIEQLSSKVIVSGFAYGIDQIAHEKAIKFGKPTIAVIGSGLENIYPYNKTLIKEMIDNNLIITEYPPLVKAKPWHFPMRNRLIASLGEQLLIIEASIKSGSLITVGIALELNKEIYALPGNVFSFQSTGTNLLLEEGANVLTLETKF